MCLKGKELFIEFDGKILNALVGKTGILEPTHFIFCTEIA